MEKDEKSKFSGIPCSEESLKEYNEDFRQIEECFEYLEKQIGTERVRSNKQR